MMENRAEAWITREIDLAQRHEELLLRREALLQGTETYYNEQEKHAASFIASFSLAEQRNRELLDDRNDFLRGVRSDHADPGTPKFKSLKNNYWTMVKNVFPVWLEEQKEYDQGGRKAGLSASPPADRRHSPVPPGVARLEEMVVNGRPPSPSPPSPHGRPPSPNGRPLSPDRKSPLKRSPKKSSKGVKSSKNKKK